MPKSTTEELTHHLYLIDVKIEHYNLEICQYYPGL